MKSSVISFFVCSVVVMATACAKQKPVKANIFERREIGDSSLVIRYEYKIEDKIYIDSTIVKNLVISQDSIDLVVDPKDEKRWIPAFKM